MRRAAPQVGPVGSRSGGLGREVLLVLALLAAGTAVAGAGADLAIEGFFFRDGSWPIGERDPWRFLFYYGLMPAWIMGFASFCFMAASVFRPQLRAYLRSAIFCLLLMFLGPALLGSGTVKDSWGRPRPHELRTFGGDSPFHQVWERGAHGAGRSFPSGHTAAGFAMLAPWFVLRGRAPRAARIALCLGSGYGALLGIARMAQGGHFLSDVLWTGGIVYLTGLALYRLLRLDREGAANRKEPAVS